MNNEIIKQTLVESFDILKDSWETKKDALIRCIVETEAYDGNIAMSMWQYILQKNQNKVTNEEEAKHLISGVLKRFCDKYDGFYHHFSGRNEMRTMLEHVAPHLVHNVELIKLLFGNSYNAGYDSSYIYSDKLPCLIASILLQGSPSIVYALFKSLANNKNMKDISIGMLLRDTSEFLEEVSSNSDLNELYSVSQEVRELLINSLNLIKDAEDRADCTITLLSL